MCTELKDASTRDRIFETVRAELLRVCRELQPGFGAEIRMESSLVADLGLDSLSVVEVVVALEQALRIEHLSLEALNERESGREGERFTVGALVDICMEQVAA